MYKFATFGIFSFIISVTSHAETIAPQAVDKIDIKQYVGKWYEISHLPMYFQRK